MIKNVDKPTIANVFSIDDKKIYRIPRYQREYTWGQKDWSNLYDDIFMNDPGYFLGSIIVIQGIVSPTSGVYEYELIDGQQRLTTISLLLAALYVKLDERKEEMNDDTRSEELVPLRNRLILKQDKSMTRIVPQVQNYNLEDFRWIVKESANLQALMQKPKNFGNRRMAKAFSYFRKRLDAEIEGLDINEAVSKLLGLVSLLCSAVVVQIDVDSHTDAYTLFASLNNRGVPLSAVDLIKNTLLAKVADADEKELDYYFEQWQEMLKNLGDDYATQERFFRQNYDAFRRSANKPFLVEGGGQWPLGYVATRSNLLKIYEKRISNPEPGALGVLDELLTNSAIYSRIIGIDEGGASDELNGQLLELARAQGVPSYLLLLYLMKNASHIELDDGDIAEVVELLVRFFVRRNVTDTPPTRDMQRLFIGICEGIEDEQVSGNDVFRYIHGKLLSRSASNSMFKERLEGPLYDENPDMARYILTALAEPSVTHEMKGLWDRYPSGSYVWTIEHVFPQGANIPDSWVDMVGGGNTALAREIQETHVHTLGNLTITGYNSKLGNLSFIEKRDRKDKNGSLVGYRNGLNLNEDLVLADTWTREQIEKRTEKLAAMTLERFSLENDKPQTD